MVEVADLGDELGLRVIGFCGGRRGRNPVPPPPTRPDELIEISGLGPRSAEVLREEGIHTFGDLAGASIDLLHERFPRVRTEVLQRWIEEATKRAGSDND